jgi:hypothetical protein
VLITIILFVLGIVLSLVVKVNHRVNDGLLTQPTFANSSEAVNIINSEERATDLMDYVFVCIFIGFFIGVLVTGWITSGHPVLAPIFFFLLIIFVFIAFVFEYAWEQFTTNPAIAISLVNVPLTNWILSNLGVLICVMGLAGMAVTYGKPYIE